MKIGTKSVLFGAHCWFIHPWFVAAAWSKLYGFPTDPRLWVAFFVHDLGYLGKPNIDGPEGETHVELGAKIMSRFDGFEEPVLADVSDLQIETRPYKMLPVDIRQGFFALRWVQFRKPPIWRDLALYHSRYYAKAAGVEVSKLCAADKLAVVLEPYWLYMPRVWLSGELKEFMTNALTKYGVERFEVATPKVWFITLRRHLVAWLRSEGFNV